MLATRFRGIVSSVIDFLKQYAFAVGFFAIYATEWLDLLGGIT